MLQPGETISIEPQVVQFNRQTTQSIRIINNTASRINDLFFCLYNVEKFSFKPQTFCLQPNEHKLIEVTLRIKSTKSIAKEFAYLKAADVSKRLTMLINNFQSPESRTKFTEQRNSEDMNTLSSRDYHEMHNRALNKIISEHQRFADPTSNLENSSSSKKYAQIIQFNQTEQFSADKHSEQNKQLEIRNVLLERDLHQITTLLTRQSQDIEKLQIDNRFLQEQGSKFLKKLTEKQERIKELEQLYQRVVYDNQQLHRDIKTLSSTAAIDKDSKQYKDYELRIKELQNAVESSQRNSFGKNLNQKIQAKDLELQQIRKALEHQELLVKQHQIKVLRLENQMTQLTESNIKLLEANKEIESMNNSLKQEVFVYKSRAEQVSNSKVQQYLQIALQSYKTQNESLKRSKAQLQKSLSSISATQRKSEQQRKYLQKQHDLLNAQINQLRLQNSKQQQIKQAIREQHHYHIMQIKNQNVKVLEKLCQEESGRRQKQVYRLNEELDQKDKEISRLKEDMSQSTDRLIERIRQLQEENDRLEEKIKKYKKETKKELKSINDNAVDELKRVHEEKKDLTRKVHKLQSTISDLQCNRIKHATQQKVGRSSQFMMDQDGRSDRDRSRTKYDYGYNGRMGGIPNRASSEHANDNDNAFGRRQGSRSKSRSNYETLYQQQNNKKKVGIHNQRRQLEESRANSVIQNGQNDQHDVGQLKELENYVRNEQERFEHIFNLNGPGKRRQTDDLENQYRRPPIKRSIQFFKNLQNKLRELQHSADESIILSKQLQFLKDRLSQYQNVGNSSFLPNPSSNNQNKNYYIRNSPHHNRNLSPNSFSQNHYQQHGDRHFKTNADADDQPSFFLNNRTNLQNNSLTSVQVLEFMKEEMRKQYAKLKESIRFSDERYEILKKKVFREYRTRIVELLNSNAVKKDKQLIGKIQNTLQRFIEGCSNVTHKEAVLHKEVKLKQAVKQENAKLKQKIHQLEHILREKKQGVCSRDPVKVYSGCNVTVVGSGGIAGGANSNINNNSLLNINTTVIKEEEWIESIKLATQLLTEKAENERLKEELQVVRQDCGDLREELNRVVECNSVQTQEMYKLKRSKADLEETYEKEIKRQNEMIEKLANDNKSTQHGTTKKQYGKEKIRELHREIEELKEQLDRKSQIIKSSKEKERKLQVAVDQSNRNTERDKNINVSYKRLEQNTYNIKEANKQLRAENHSLKEEIDKLRSDLDKKKAYIKNLKAQQQQESRIKPSSGGRIQEVIQRTKQLEQALENAREQLKNSKKLKARQISKLQGQIHSQRSDAIIRVKALESVVRATVETIRKLFTSLKILIKKKGLRLSSEVSKSQFLVPEDLTQINAGEIYERFQQMLSVIQSST